MTTFRSRLLLVLWTTSLVAASLALLRMPFAVELKGDSDVAVISTLMVAFHAIATALIAYLLVATVLTFITTINSNSRGAASNPSGTHRPLRLELAPSSAVPVGAPKWLVRLVASALGTMALSTSLGATAYATEPPPVMRVVATDSATTTTASNGRDPATAATVTTSTAIAPSTTATATTTSPASAPAVTAAPRPPVVKAPSTSDSSRETATAGSMGSPTNAPQHRNQNNNEWTVANGQSFWTIAESRATDELGRAPSDDEIVDGWEKLIDVNRDRLHDRGNPDLLFPGQVLLLPAS